MERAGVDSELTKLERLHASWRNEQAILARRVRTGQRDAAEQTDLAATYRQAAARAVDISGERFAMVVDHHTYRQRTKAATVLQHAVLDAQRHLPVGERRAVPVGELAGFDVIATVSNDTTETSATLGLAGVPRSTPTFTRDELRHNPPLGMITRLENLASDLEARADQAARKADELRAETAKAAARIGRPFEQSNRIDMLRRRLTAIDAELAPPEPPPDSPSPSPHQPQLSLSEEPPRGRAEPPR